MAVLVGDAALESLTAAITRTQAAVDALIRAAAADELPLLSSQLASLARTVQVQRRRPRCAVTAAQDEVGQIGACGRLMEAAAALEVQQRSLRVHKASLRA